MYVKIRSANIHKYLKDRKVRSPQDKNHNIITKFEKGEII